MPLRLQYSPDPIFEGEEDKVELRRYHPDFEHRKIAGLETFKEGGDKDAVRARIDEIRRVREDA